MAKRSAKKSQSRKKQATSSQDASSQPTDAHVNVWPNRPKTHDELHHWIHQSLGYEIARNVLVDGHTPPFAYLCHTFFEEPKECAGEACMPRDCVVWANRGGGKTFLGALATLLDMVFKPGIEIRLLGGSLDQSRRMHAHLCSFLDRENFAWMLDGKISDRRVKLKNRSAVELLSQSQTSVRGTRVQKLRCDEVDLFDRDVWEAAQLVTQSKQCGEVWVHGTIECLSTMHIPHGVMHSLVEEAKLGKRSLFKWGTLDVMADCRNHPVCIDSAQNPDTPCALGDDCQSRLRTRKSGFGHVLIDDALKMRSRVSRATWEAEMLCLRPKRTDAVLPEFNHAIHVVDYIDDALLEHATWIGGMDFGMRSPTVVLWGGLDEDDVLWIVDEHVESGLTLSAHIEAMHARPLPAMAWIGVDPAGGQRNSQTGKTDIALLKQHGFTVRARRLALYDGLELIRARLTPAGGEPKLRIHSRCRKLIESLERYHYPADNPYAIVPEKDGFDHQVDALRYMITNLDKPYTTKNGNYL
ncbi:MAG: hypothetical protein H6815_02880 [Phycisphaeraceae bacterium]|nr:hypothetical protein [Phycisphaerales bacterium]MCB9859371.1 hypothetical protein [Phycisphaeraceae bacterium]